jgi:hypothetical protein
MPVSASTGVVTLTQQDHAAIAAAGFVWIADADRPDRLDRTRLTSWRAHRCRRDGSNNFTRWSGIRRVWSAYGLWVFTGKPISVARINTFSPTTGVLVMLFAPHIASLPTRQTLVAADRPRLGGEAKQNKKYKRKSRQRANRWRFDCPSFNHQATSLVVALRSPSSVLVQASAAKRGRRLAYRRFHARRVPRSGDPSIPMGWECVCLRSPAWGDQLSSGLAWPAKSLTKSAWRRAPVFA